MLRLVRLFVLLALSALAPAAAAQTPGAEAKAAEDADKLPSVSVAEARRASFVETILVTGSLVAREEVLISPQIDGYRIIELLAEDGDRVKAGQTLARLDRSALEAQLAQQTAQLARAEAAIAQAQSLIVQNEASLKQADAAFARAKDLIKTGATTQSVYDEREAAARTAAAAVVSAKDGLILARAEKTQIEAQIRESRVKLGYTDISTPVDGLISRRTARLGAMAAQSADPLFRIVTKGEIELEAEAPEEFMSKLRLGRAASVNVAGLNDRAGTVRLISAEVDKATRLGKVRIFVGDDPQLRVGSFARAVIQIDSSEGVAVPASAVLYLAGGAAVQAVENGVVKTVPVKLGLRTGDLVEVRSGLSEGQIVVARSGTLLREGDRVRPVLPNATAVSEVR
ncbi:MAG: efflux RND transporter periplasmic adaptor subunit [Hyphomicrobiales bacterium]|nr:efflux RND transporter periplasmic adaptor subunit [Hyphomicrobiales bacterium]